MVITKGFPKNSYESFSSSDVSYKNVFPPWCSSRKVCDRRKLRRVMSKREIHSTYPLRENVGEYLYENNDGNFNYSIKKTKATVAKKNRSRKIVVTLLILLFIGAGIASLLMFNEMPRADLITKVISRCKFLTLLGVEQSTEEEFCQRIMYLTSKLSKIEYALKYKIRQRKTMPVASNTYSDINNNKINHPYIEGATAIKSSDTEQWVGRVALWGIVPLWRAAPPLNTIFALRKPTPSDCWPFRGRQGEVIIHLPHIQPVTYVSVEHIQPDTVKSAPKDFVIYGILVNDTRISLINDHYETREPAKQFYPVKIKTLFKGIVFRILTNQGNPNYTCLYRVHIYGNS